jgi:hypothetical protein
MSASQIYTSLSSSNDNKEQSAENNKDLPVYKIHHNDNNYWAYMRNAGFILKRGFITYARPLAYTSELGEATRPIVPLWFVRMMYGVTFAYVGIDTLIKTHETWIETEKDPLQNKKTAIKLFDTIVWHGSASISLPALTIHTTVKYTGILVNKFYQDPIKTIPPTKEYTKFISRTLLQKVFSPSAIPSWIGIAMIPFIIHPLDHLTDYWMDRSVRRLYM